MTNLRIYVECHPNEDIRTLHLSKPTFHKPFSKYDENGLPKKIEALNKKLSNAIELREEPVSLKEVRIERNKAFSWEEAIDSAVSILKKYFGEETVEVEIMERNPEWDRPWEDRYDY